MPSLLVQSCSATKKDAQSPVQAIDLYDGYFFKIIDKAMRTGQFRPEIDIVIISAKHGVVDPGDKIKKYDQRMRTERAAELNDQVVRQLVDKVHSQSYEEIWLNLGFDYLPAVNGLQDAVDVPVSRIEGEGIGAKGKQLKRFVTTRPSDPIHGD